MGCDMVVTLGRATVDGSTLFGHNSGRPRRECQALQRVPGRSFTPGEKVRLQHLEIPQARQTYTVLANQPAGLWGYQHGVNACGVAIGRGTVHTRLRCQGPGLRGADLVRLTLERAPSARQAVDVLTDLVKRHGQETYSDSPPEAEGDSSFLIVDAQEAFAIETSGAHWVYQEIRQLRAMSDVSTVHQDWDRISPGLSDEAIAQGWWPGDGSKLDFAGALCTDGAGHESGLRRWGRATLMLEQQNGRIDLGFVRRLLSDHYEGCNEEVDPLDAPARPVPLCQHASAAHPDATAASLVVQVPARPDRLLVAWCAFGPPCMSVYFPVFLEAELPEAFSRADPAADGVWQRMRQLEAFLGTSRERWDLVHEQLGRLQGQLDHDAEDFAAEGAGLKQQGPGSELERLAGLFVQHCLERFDKVFSSLRSSVSGYQPSTPVGR